MIHQIGRELEARLLSQGCPYRVFDREATRTATWGNPRIVVDHDTDRFGPPRGLSTNPKKHYTRTVGCKITIYGKSARTGAKEFEHREVVEAVLTQVLVGMRYVAAERLNRYTLTGGQFVVPKDLEGSDAHGGAAYEIKFTFDQAVAEQTWAGAFQPEATLGLLMSGTPDLTFVAAGSSVERSEGSWVADGFTVGMVVTIAGSADNDITAAIATVAADVITLSSVTLVDEGPVSGCTVRAGGFSSCTLVSRTAEPDNDNNPNTPPDTSEVACGDCGA